MHAQVGFHGRLPSTSEPMLDVKIRRIEGAEYLETVSETVPGIRMLRSWEERNEDGWESWNPCSSGGSELARTGGGEAGVQAPEITNTFH
jgi:hypothetical protein